MNTYQVDIGGGTEAQHDSDSLQLSSGQRLYPILHDGIHAHGAHHIAHELRVDVGVSDLLVQQHPHRAIELGGDLLGLVADVQLGHAEAVCCFVVLLGLSFGLLVTLQQACQHANEGGLAGTVLSKHYHNLGVGELALLNVQLERLDGRTGNLGTAHRLGHGWVVVKTGLAGVLEKLRVGGQLEVQLLVAEPQVLGGHETRQEDVDALTHGERHGHHSVGRGGAV